MKRKLFLGLLLISVKILFAQSESDFVVENYGEGVVIKDYINTSIKDVTIPSTINGKSVLSIGYSAFRNNGLTSVIIPNTVVIINWLSFFENPLLTTVTIEDNSNLRVIAKQAFDYYGSSLSKIQLPTNINPNFEGYVDADGVMHSEGSEISDFNITYAAKIPYTLTQEDVVFENGEIKDFNNFTEKWIIIPDNFGGENVVSIGKEAFYESSTNTNYLLVNVTFPNTIETIGYYAFRNNELLEVEIPKSVQVIDSHAFDQNEIRKLSFELGSNLRIIGDFAYNSNEIDSLLIPKSIERIEEYAFYNNKLKKLVFEEGSNLKEIYSSAFLYNILTSITIPKSVISIGSETFMGSQLNEVKFEENSIIQNIGEKAFFSDNLPNFTLPVPNKLGYTFDNWYYGNGVVVENYITTDLDSSFTAILELNTYSIDYVNLGKFDNPNVQDIYTVESDPITLIPLYKDGYNFQGWFTNIEMTDTVNTPAIDKGSIGDTTFYAKWDLINYNINYHNIGNVRNNNPFTYTVEDEIALRDLNSFDSTNYVFAGWFKRDYIYGSYYTEERIDSIKSGNIGDIDIYAKWLPDGDEVFKSGNFSITSYSPSCKDFTDGFITIKSELFDLAIFIQETNTNHAVNKGDSVIIENLTAGTYHLNISVVDGVERNFTVQILSAKQVSAKALIEGDVVTFYIEGGEAPYNVQIGNDWYITETGRLTVNDLKAGNYTVLIQDKNTCNEDVILNFDIEKFSVYPNPVRGSILYVVMPTSIIGKECELRILSTDGISEIVKNEIAKEFLDIDISVLKADTYILQVNSDQYKSALKFIVKE